MARIPIQEEPEIVDRVQYAWVKPFSPPASPAQEQPAPTDKCP